MLALPGCGLFASLDLLNPYLPSGATHAWGLAIPNNSALIGVHLHASAAMWTIPPLNPFGVVTANGIDGVLGRM